VVVGEVGGQASTTADCPVPQDFTGTHRSLLAIHGTTMLEEQPAEPDWLSQAKSDPEI